MTAKPHFLKNYLMTFFKKPIHVGVFVSFCDERSPTPPPTPLYNFKIAYDLATRVAQSNVLTVSNLIDIT